MLICNRPIVRGITHASIRLPCRGTDRDVAERAARENEKKALIEKEKKAAAEKKSEEKKSEEKKQNEKKPDDKPKPPQSGHRSAADSDRGAL